MNVILNPWQSAADTIRVRGWAQGAMQTPDGEVCLTGALKVCDLQPGDWLIARAVARHRGHGEDWNDDAERTEIEVLEWLDTAAPITDSELAEVYGPQWEPLVALIRRAATLTDAEREALAAASLARDEAWAASWGASAAASRDAARDASAAASRDAAWGAALALIIRDLIGQHGFTQADYDLLTGPWRQVIGPVHPDDEGEVV